MPFVIVVLAISTSTISSASAQTASSFGYPRFSQFASVSRDPGDRRVFLPEEAINQQYTADLQRLRSKALVMQRNEGGVLSPASRANFQQRLDKINSFYQRRLRENDLFSVDGSGNSVR